MRPFFAALIAAGCVLIAACSNPSGRVALDAADLTDPPPRAAEYITTLAQRGGQRDEQVWRVWRDNQRVEVAQLDSDSGEAWQRSGATTGDRELLFFFRLFHADRTAIEYAPTELAALGMAGDWQRAQLLVSPQTLQQLRPVAGRTLHGRRAITYRGEIDGERIDIDWLVDDKLPARIQRRSGDRTTTITLRALHPLAAAPWQRPPSRNYRIIDYADLGDMERDPFVQRVLSMIPGGELHDHAH